MMEEIKNTAYQEDWKRTLDGKTKDELMVIMRKQEEYEPEFMEMVKLLLYEKFGIVADEIDSDGRDMQEESTTLSIETDPSAQHQIDKQEQGSTLTDVLVLFAGAFSGIFLSIIWAKITIVSNYQISWMAILVGVVIGMVVRQISKRQSILLAVLSAIIASMTCILGDFFANVGFLAEAESMEYFETLAALDPAYYFEIAFINLDSISISFYVIAAIIAFGICNKDEKEDSASIGS